MNYDSDTFKLYHREIFIGSISNVHNDSPWLIGEIEVTEDFEEYREVFDNMSDDEDDDDPPIEKNHWFIEDEDGNKEQIYLPQIHDGSEVWWKWGDPEDMDDDEDDEDFEMLEEEMADEEMDAEFR
jgi:hypothetical protein